jgi:hypothetical protein
VDSVHGYQLLVQERRETGKLLDTSTRRTEEAPQAGNKVDATIEKETTLMVWSFPP